MNNGAAAVDRLMAWLTTPAVGGGWRGGRVVYCGGLENRFGFTADGGSNPSLSANAVEGMVERN